MEDTVERFERVIREVSDTNIDISHVKSIVQKVNIANRDGNRSVAIARSVDELNEALRNTQEKVNAIHTDILAVKGLLDTLISSNVTVEDDNGRKGIEELLKILIVTSGVVLTLLWGLTQGTPLITKHIFHIIRWASFILVFAMAAAFLSYQFSITRLQKNLKAAKVGNPRSEVSRHPTIAVPFMVAWISFLVGCSFLLWAMWNIKFRP